MIEPSLKPLFPTIDPFKTLKNSNNNFTNFSKDLFTKKLGHKITFKDKSITKRNNPILRHPFIFKNFHPFPKSNSHINLFNTINKEENTSKISFSRNKSICSNTKDGIFGLENNKQMVNNPFNITIKNFNQRGKKGMKTWFDNINMKKDFIFNEKSKTKRLESIKRFRNKDINNIGKIKFDGESKNNKENTEYKKFPIKKIEFKNKNENKIIKKEENNNSLIFIKYFLEDFIELSNIFDSFKEYKTMVNKFNETFFLLFEIDSFPSNYNLNSQFLYTYKFSSILIICLIFLSKDENLYKENMLKMKHLFQQYIYITLNSIDYKMIESSKINFFIDKMILANEYSDEALIDKLNEIINLLFVEKVNEYKKLRKCLKQLLNNIDKLNPKQILILVNKSFLFCHNCHYFKGNQKNEKSEYIKTDQSIMTDSSLSKSDKDIKDEIKIKEIKNKLNKKYCLVINLGETLIHNMNMPFGDYFFVRPGYFDLFEKVHDNFEIIIFTKEKKDAAEEIINKINYKNYIDNTFYEKNKIYEDDNFIKNLESIWGNTNNIIYVDNSRITDKNKKINLYKISSWYNNIFDSELIQLKNKLINLANKEILDKDNTQNII